MPKHYPLVHVEWLDSRSPIGAWKWLSEVDLAEIVACQSVGFLVLDNDKVIALAPNVGDLNDEDPQVSGVIRIPKCAIQRMTFLSLPTKLTNQAIIG